MIQPPLTELPTHIPILLDNETCVYCGVALDLVENDKDHVIGKNFVPKGKFDGQWNLLVRACKSCNNAKSKLEDDISAISMQTDAFGRYATADPALEAGATRKGKSTSRRTGKTVKDSSENLTIKIPFASGVEATVEMTSPPQIDTHRIFQLSHLHLMGFFYWVTYNYQTKKGEYWPGVFMPLSAAPRLDWGNRMHRAFMDAVALWDPRVLAVGADGFVKVVIRRHPSAVCWSWALEWNQNYRIVGFIGEQGSAEVLVKSFPRVDRKTMRQGTNGWVRCQEEMSLAAEDDKLFYWVGDVC